MLCCAFSSVSGCSRYEHDLFDDRILCRFSYLVLGGDQFGVLG